MRIKKCVFRGILLALQLAHDKGFRKILIESNPATAVALITNSCPSSHPTKNSFSHSLAFSQRLNDSHLSYFQRGQQGHILLSQACSLPLCRFSIFVLLLLRIASCFYGRTLLGFASLGEFFLVHFPRRVLVQCLFFSDLRASLLAIKNVYLQRNKCIYILFYFIIKK